MFAARYRMRPRSGIRFLAALLASPLLIAATLPYETLDDAGSAPRGMPNLAALGAPVADEELGEMRGKFITADAVSYFGISMLTSWQDSAGITTLARLAFSIDFLVPSGGGPAVPRLFVSWAREGDPNMDVAGTSDGYVAVATSPDQVIPIGALDTTAGAAQVNVIAGADNLSRNGMQIAIVPRSSLGEMNTQGMQEITSTLGMGFADGDGLQFRLGDNELALVMTGNNGSDSTLQSIGGELGRMLQQTMLNSDNNSVMNNASIVFGIGEQVQNMGPVSASGAMSVLKGFGL